MNNCCSSYCWSRSSNLNKLSYLEKNIDINFINIIHNIMQFDSNTDITHTLNSFISWINIYGDEFQFLTFLDFLQKNNRKIYAYHLIPFAVAILSKEVKKKNINLKQYPELCFSLDTNKNYEHYAVKLMHYFFMEHKEKTLIEKMKLFEVQTCSNALYTMHPDSIQTFINIMNNF